MKTPILSFWKIAYKASRFISPFAIVGKIFPKLVCPKFVDIWILVHLFLSALAWFVSRFEGMAEISFVFLFYGGIRFVEMVVYNSYVVLTSSQQQPLFSYKRSIILLMHCYVEMLFWFAAAYTFFAGYFHGAQTLSTWSGSLYYSLVTASTLGYGDVYPNHAVSRIIVMLQILGSLLLTLIVAARLISILPRPGTSDESEK